MSTGPPPPPLQGLLNNAIRRLERCEEELAQAYHYIDTLETSYGQLNRENRTAMNLLRDHNLMQEFDERELARHRADESPTTSPDSPSKGARRGAAFRGGTKRYKRHRGKKRRRTCRRRGRRR